MRMFRRRQDTDSYFLYLFLFDYKLHVTLSWCSLDMHVLYDLHDSLYLADFVIILVALVCPSHSE
jgi:hypothetical protein